MRSFDQIYIVDLHGSSKPKELVPEGLENENVFDIQKGVAIALFIKKPGVEKGIFHFDIWGNRLSKYQECASTEFTSVSWATLDVIAPYFMMSPVDWRGWNEYGAWWQIADSLNPTDEKKQIFNINVLGFQTHRDHFAIAPGRIEMDKRIRDLLDPTVSDASLRERYSLKDNRDWKLSGARKALRSKDAPYDSVIDCAYRPFDSRPSFFGPEFMDYPRREMIDHVAGRDNLVLLVPRQLGTEHWRHAFVANAPANDCVVSDASSEANYVFPNWLYNEHGRVSDNFSPDFRDFLDARYDYHYSPEEIFGYIYAVLHAPIYRMRYAEFLRIDFPRIPYPEDGGHFEALSALGWALVQAHLMRGLPRTGHGQLQGRGDALVEHVRWSAEDRTVSINSTQGFAPVPEEVWNFHIGGYQVLDKYLKSRKGRRHFSDKGRDAGDPYPLTLDEITQVGRICDALSFTIGQMERIDAAYAQAFPERG